MLFAALLGCVPPSSPNGEPTGDSSGDGLPPVRLVVPTSRGVGLRDLDGTVAYFRTWPDLVGGCPVCGGEGASLDDDGGLLLSFTTDDDDDDGAIARLRRDGSFDFRVDGLEFPHGVIRDPADDTLIVVETFENRLNWIAGNGDSPAPLRTLGMEHPQFDAKPNGAERIDLDGRVYLVVSHLSPSARGGTLTLWDISEAGQPQHVWTFPPSGQLGRPHSPRLRRVDGDWWLLWAHTDGRDLFDGTVGLAHIGPVLTEAPAYVADLQPSDRFEFLRGVELDPNGTLYLTDSGQPPPGRITTAPWPSLEPEGQSGTVGSRRFVELGETTLVDGLSFPFEAWLGRFEPTTWAEASEGE